MNEGTQQARLLELGEAIVRGARDKGADVAEAVVREGSELTARVRMGQVEMLREASYRGAALRVMKGRRVAITSTSDLSAPGVDRFVRDAIELADLSQDDPYAGPADPSLLAEGPFEDFESFDPAVLDIDAAQAIDAATRADAAARAFDPRITNMQDATCSRVVGSSAVVLSSGFRSARRRTSLSIGAVAVADDAGGKKRRGSWGEVRRQRADVPEPEAIGRIAASRTVDMLGARKVPTCEAPVVFPSEAARAILALVAGCAIGSSIWRKASYLIDREGTRVASDLVTIVDDPFLVRGFGSRAHDGEGLASRRNVVVERGILRAYLCDGYAGRKLGRASTASAARGAGGGVGPSTSNIVLEPSADTTEEDIIASTKRGLLVRQMMGYGFNPSTGDFSRGAAGHWIEDGKLAYAVSEVTISLNLNDLLCRIDAVANRCVQRSSALSPMVRVSSMTIAGS